VLSSCSYKTGSGDIISDTRTVRAFSGLEVEGPFEVIITTGSPDKLVIEADDNLMEYVETEVDGNTLEIRLSRRFNLRDAHLKAYVSSGEINKVHASAAANVTTKTGLVSANKIDLSSSSGASINGNVDAPNVTGKASSGSKLDLRGKARNLNLSSSSGATIHAYDLLSENTSASSSSGASIQTFASLDMNASASSGGEVTFRGPGRVKKNESSGGSVKRVD